MKKILIVEDEKDLLDMIILQAEHKRFSCISDETGAHAVQKAIKEMPHMILLDLNLPQISGLGIIKELKKYPATLNIPIIVFSANNQKLVVAEAMESGANAFFTKTRPIHELFHLINQYL